MNHDNLNFAHIKNSTTVPFANIAKIMCTTLLFSCSQKSTALYSSDDVHHFIMECCLGNCYSESTANKLKIRTQCTIPSGSWIRKHIAKIPKEKMVVLLSNGIDQTISHLKNMGMLNHPVIVAIDKHFIPRYDKTNSA